MTTLGVDDESTAVGLGWRVVVEGEVAEAIVDVGTAQESSTEQYVGIRPDHDVRPGLDQLLGERGLLGVRTRLGLGTPVHVDDHGVGRPPHLLDLTDELGGIDGRGHPWLCSGGGPRTHQVVGDDLRRRDDGDALPIDGHPVGREGLRGVVADPDDRVLVLRRDGEVLRKPLGPAVEAVVVGLRGQGDGGALERGDRRSGSIEDVLLVLRFGTRAVGHGRLEVHHAQVGSREQVRNGGAECGGGVLGQALADRSREVHVPGEAQADRLPVALPVRIEGRVLREAFCRGDVVRGCGRRRRRTRTAGEEDQVDQQEEDQDPADGELAPPAHDPA